MRRLAETLVAPDDDGGVAVEEAKCSAAGLLGPVEPLQLAAPDEGVQRPVLRSIPSWRRISAPYAAMRSAPFRYEEISQGSGVPAAGRQTAV